jgi:CcmD family protein
MDEQKSEPRSVRVVLRSATLTQIAEVGALAVGLFAGTQVRAQDAAEERSQSFKAVQGAVKEDVPGGPLLVAAYGVVWAVLLVYVIRLALQQQRAQADLVRLERVLAQSETSR